MVRKPAFQRPNGWVEQRLMKQETLFCEVWEDLALESELFSGLTPNYCYLKTQLKQNFPFGFDMKDLIQI